MSLVSFLSNQSPSPDIQLKEQLKVILKNKDVVAWENIRTTVENFSNLVNDDELWQYSWHVFDAKMASLILKSLPSENITHYLKDFSKHYPLSLQEQAFQDLFQEITSANIELKTGKYDWPNALTDVNAIEFPSQAPFVRFVLNYHKPKDPEELFFGALLSGNTFMLSVLVNAYPDEYEHLAWDRMIKEMMVRILQSPRTDDKSKLLNAIDTLRTTYSWFDQKVENFWSKGMLIPNPLSWVDVSSFENLGIVSSLTPKKSVRVHSLDQAFFCHANQSLFSEQVFPHVDWSKANIQDMMVFCGNVREMDRWANVPRLLKSNASFRQWSDAQGNTPLHYMASSIAIGFMDADAVIKTIKSICLSHLGEMNKPNQLAQTPLSILKSGFGEDGQMDFGKMTPEQCIDVMDLLSSKWMATNISKAISKSSKTVMKSSRKM